MMNYGKYGRKENASVAVVQVMWVMQVWNSGRLMRIPWVSVTHVVLLSAPRTFILLAAAAAPPQWQSRRSANGDGRFRNYSWSRRCRWREGTVKCSRTSPASVCLSIWLTDWLHPEVLWLLSCRWFFPPPSKQFVLRRNTKGPRCLFKLIVIINYKQCWCGPALKITSVAKCFELNE